MLINKSLELCQLAARGSIGKSTGDYSWIHHKRCTRTQWKSNQMCNDRAQEGSRRDAREGKAASNNTMEQ